MIDSIKLPLLREDATSWMRSHGWREVSEGPAGWLWSNEELDESVGITHSFDNDSDAQHSLISRLARYHSSEQETIAGDIATWRTDTALIRAANDSIIADTIPLIAGSAMLESAKQMYRSAATSAIKIRANISGNYSKVGDQVLDQVRMGHTRRGSYIVPIHVPVGLPDVLDTGTIPGAEIEQLAEQIESVERRTSRTFAQAFNSIDRVVIQPARVPKSDDLENLVAHGVSREFISAMNRTLLQPAVAQLDASFHWAGAQLAPSSIPAKVEIPAIAAPLLEQVAHKLKLSKPPRHETYTGPVVVVAREVEDQVTRFSIRTVSNGRASLVEASTTQPLAEVTRWMNKRTIVQLQGVVTRISSGIVMEKSEVTLLDQIDF